jgi:signal transduction histidine kinase
MGTLRSRLVFSHLLPLVLIAPLMSVLLIFILETQVLLSSLARELTGQANLIAATMGEHPDVWSDAEYAQRMVVNMSNHVSGGVMLFQHDGQLVASSEPGSDQMVLKMKSSPGMGQALAGNHGTWTYYGLLEQRVAVLVPVHDPGGRPIGVIGLTESLQEMATGFSRLRRWVILILLNGFVLAAVAGLALARRLEEPITEVTAAVVSIASGRRADLVPEEGPEEIRRLAEAVNMLARRLRLMEETRRRMLANLVHELGRPLGALRSAIHVLRRGADEDPAVREELLAGAEDQIVRMQPLLDDLARLHGQVLGQVELERYPVPLAEWLPSVANAWRAAAEEKGLNWELDLPEALPTANIDADRMAQALGNLLSNAIKYTPAGGLVSLSAGQGQGEVWIRVSDTGPGIAPEELERVFEPFYRSARVQRFPQGLGLGLTIARDLVEAHGGRVELRSRPGNGSAFTVWLPVGG